MWSVTLYGQTVTASNGTKLIAQLNEIFKENKQPVMTTADWYNLSQVRKMNLAEDVILKIYGKRLLSIHKIITKVEKFKHKTIQILDKKEIFIVGKYESKAKTPPKEEISV